jgi:hypothetical protein
VQAEDRNSNQNNVLRKCGQAVSAALAATIILVAPSAAQTSPLLEEPPRSGLIDETDEYAKALDRRHNRSKGIVTDTSANQYMMESYAEDMFTPEAWVGMQALVAYGHYVDTLADLEAEEDCFQCKANRDILEHAWQVVANEFYDPLGRFNQGHWAGELQKTLQANGGAVRV